MSTTYLTSWTGTVPGSSPNHDWLWLDPINTASRLADIWTSQAKEAGNFPPYDLTRNEDSTQWKLTMALAGFSPEELDVTVEQNQLIIKGETSKKADDKYTYNVHKGIAQRSFTRKFTLGDYVEVKNVAYQNGILDVQLELVLPESKKPKKFAIKY